MAKKKTSKTPKLPPVGARVRMRFGLANVVATVTEHRGPLGVGGRQILGVRFQFEGPGDPIETEVPLEEVTLVDDVPKVTATT